MGVSVRSGAPTATMMKRGGSAVGGSGAQRMHQFSSSRSKGSRDGSEGGRSAAGRNLTGGLVRRRGGVQCSRVRDQHRRSGGRGGLEAYAVPAALAVDIGGGDRRRARGVEMKASAAAAMPVGPDDGPDAAKAPAPPAGGVKVDKLLIAAAIGCALNFLVPVPSGITPQAWRLLSVFVTTIAGLVLEPLPVGAWAFSCLTFVAVTNILSFQAAFAAFTNEVIWLIVISFFFALGFEKTGLGSRVAVMFVSWFGKSSLGLGYGLAMSETLLSPAIPSTTARAGGIFVPIIKSLSATAGSLPGETAGKIGKFLVHSQLQASAGSSAMFMTGAAQNILCLNLASQLGVIVPNAFSTWFVAAVVPAFIVTFMSPLLCYWMVPPELKETPEAPAQARAQLEEMGPMSKDEWMMLATMVGAVGLWIVGDSIGISSVVTAMLGLTSLLYTGVLKWSDCLKCTTAWDTLLWFSVLVGMSAQLNELGIIKCFQEAASGAIAASGMGWYPSYLCVSTLYFVVHYFFASQTAHTGALFAAGLATMLAAGTPGVVAALTLGYLTNLFGSINHYASGQAAIYYSSGYVTLPEMMSQGAIHGVLKFVVWMAVSGVWFRVIGLF